MFFFNFFKVGLCGVCVCAHAPGRTFKANLTKLNRFHYWKTSYR